ncbi:MAG: hypothetical protein JWP27_274 [Flaviaesturariibacter sp.]|nr:hypothetical protein [Flaviaesturariibacter sp.]
MKKILACLFATALGVSAFAQDAGTTTAPTKRGSYIGVSYVVNDFASAQRIRSTSLTTVLSNHQFTKLKDMSPGIGITYFKGLSKFVDLAVSAVGTFPKVQQADQSFSSGDDFLLETDASVNVKMFSERYLFSPYGIAGVGISHLTKKFDAFVPLGLGLKANIFNEAAIFLTTQYRIPITNNTNNYHFQFGLGFAGRIGKD